MKYAGMELVWLLLAYSFFGWVIETIAGTIKKKKFVNRGFSSGPFCLIYGIAAVMMTTTMQELIEYPFFLFLGCAILATIIEWFAGKLLERLNQHKWWDYSEKKWNFDGYICLQYSILWGILGVLTVRFADRWLVQIYDWIPELFRTILMTSLLVLMALDLSVSLAAGFQYSPADTGCDKAVESPCRGLDTTVFQMDYKPSRTAYGKGIPSHF